jgi:hypothetical protein
MQLGMRRTRHGWLALGGLLLAACSGSKGGEDQVDVLPSVEAGTTPQNDAGAATDGATGGDSALAVPDAQTSDAAASDASTADASAGDASLSDASAGDASSPDASVPFEGEGTPWKDPAPRAKCSEGDKVDGTVQALNGDYRCNLQLVGEVAAPHFLSLAWHKDCAYVNGPDGTSVISVAPDGKPSVVTTLTELGFRSNWESMKLNSVSGLLAGYESNGATLAVYDVSADCKAPVLQSSTHLQEGLIGSLGHAGSFSPDGTIYYASSMFTSQVFAVDLALPKTPKVLSAMFDRGAHDLYIAKGGNRGYFANPDVTALGVGSFAVMDLSQIQARQPGAKGTLLHELKWEDGNVSQYPILLSYGGKDHLMITDELGLGSCDNPAKPQWGYARIFDISDEKNPKLVSLIKTEAQDPKNCKAEGQPAGGAFAFGIGTHYCNVDRVDNPRLLSCGEWDAGVRVFDIRNPWRPKEVAYFDTPTANVPGLTRIYVEKRELWVAVTPGTFYVLKFPAGGVVDQILAQ